MASESEVSICNSALIMLGADPILSLTEDESDRAIACNQFYNETRDAVLEAYPWNFATGRAVLAPDADNPEFGYSFQYSLPNNPDYCLKVRFCYPRDDDVEYKVEGRKLHSDDSTIKIVYTKRVTAVSQFNFLFRQALEVRLAAMLCYPVTGSTTLRSEMWKAYDNYLTDAENSDTQEGTVDNLDSPDLLDVRTGYPGRRNFT